MLENFFGKNSFLKKIPNLLRLDKPLIIFDLETTGLALSDDKIVKLVYIKIYPQGAIKQGDIYLDPGVSISREASVVHGITDEEVRGKPTFREKAREIWDVFYDCYYAGFNIGSFDLPVLRREFVRVGMDFEYKAEQVIDSREIFYHMVPRTLGATYEYYCHKEYKRKYTTPTDAEAAAEILYHQFTRYSEIRNREFLCKLQKAQFENEEAGIRNFYWRDGQAHFAFSKHIDKSVAEVAGEDPGFLRWMLKAHFAPETKEIVKLALSEHAYVSRQPDNSEKDE